MVLLSSIHISSFPGSQGRRCQGNRHGRCPTRMEAWPASVSDFPSKIQFEIIASCQSALVAFGFGAPEPLATPPFCTSQYTLQCPFQENLKQNGPNSRTQALKDLWIADLLNKPLTKLKSSSNYQQEQRLTFGGIWHRKETWQTRTGRCRLALDK